MAESPPHPSFWLESTAGTDYPPLERDVSVDVAVLGAGITGITAAVLLKRAGRTVALVEAKRIVRGATGYTTAKVTAGHGLIYAHLRDRFGADGARLYAEANQAGLERIVAFAREDGIDCDLERKANYIYAEAGDEIEQLESEVEAAKGAGLAVSLVRETPLPYPVTAAIRLEQQAQFHPRKYLLPLAATLPGDGSHVFELTRALDVDEGDPCRVTTDRATIEARDVVVATHLPFLDRGLFFAKTSPHRSYAVAAPLDAAAAPDGMFINTGTPTRSVRTIRDGDRLLIQVGGQGHKPGEEPDPERCYAELESFLREHWPQAGEVEYRWSTQDYMPHDKVPYVGRIRRGSKHAFTATGFNKWGMTNGTAAAMMLSDRILGRDNPWSDLFDSKRLKPRASAGKFLKENSHVGLRFFTDRLKRADRDSADELKAGEGAIVRLRGRKRAAYRNEAGELHLLSPVCTHLRCHVGWNPAERSWDCPCHGSRFSGEGRVIQGPAVEDLNRVE